MSNVTTLRQLSERIRDHLKRQKATSLVAGGASGCAYRGAGGRMCAVGILISDEHYSGKFEGMSIFDDERVTAAVERSLGVKLGSEGIEMLGQWQTYHDSRGYYRYWLEAESGEAPKLGSVSPDQWHDVCMRDFDGDLPIGEEAR